MGFLLAVDEADIILENVVNVFPVLVTRCNALYLRNISLMQRAAGEKIPGRSTIFPVIRFTDQAEGKCK
jgi:hypothetical protein